MLAALCGYAGGLVAFPAALMIFIDGNPREPEGTVVLAVLMAFAGLAGLIGTSLIWTPHARWGAWALAGAGTIASIACLPGVLMLGAAWLVFEGQRQSPGKSNREQDLTVRHDQ